MNLTYRRNKNTSVPVSGTWSWRVGFKGAITFGELIQTMVVVGEAISFMESISWLLSATPWRVTQSIDRNSETIDSNRARWTMTLDNANVVVRCRRNDALLARASIKCAFWKSHVT